MKQITLTEAFEDIKQLFQVRYGFENRKEGLSFFSKNSREYTFWFNKNEYERNFVLERLYDYFKDKTLINGQCSISPITFIFTKVSLKSN